MGVTMELVTREEWGARPAKTITHRPLSIITAFVFHYADAGAAPKTPDEERSVVKAIQSFHMNVKGWSDIAYHALVGAERIYQGRPIDVVGAHCEGFNTPSIGICFLTNDGFGPSTGAAAVAFAQFVEFSALHRRLDVFAHREKRLTHCPGDRIFSWVENVRAAGGPLAK